MNNKNEKLNKDISSRTPQGKPISQFKSRQFAKTNQQKLRSIHKNQELPQYIIKIDQFSTKNYKMETVTRAQGKKQSKETDSKSAHMLGLAKTSKQTV